MTCKDIEAYLRHDPNRKLSAEESKQITEHLLRCGACEAQYRRHKQIDTLLKAFGGAVRGGIENIHPPPMPARQSGLLAKVRDWLTVPVPVWVPSLVSVGMLVVFVAATFSPLNVSIEWGKEKGSTSTPGVTAPPLAAESMLEFLIVPDSTDAGQLAASVEAIEAFLKTYPDDVAMHAKLIELYQLQLGLPSLPASERNVLVKRLSNERTHFVELLTKKGIMKGVENVKE